MNKSNVSRTVESYLDDVNYADYSGYVPSDFALKFITFLKLVNGPQGEENETPVAHFIMLDQLTNKEDKVANLCARGFAKTSVFAEYLFLYLGVYGELPHFGKVDLALYVSDSIENGVKNLRKNIEHRWNNSDFLQKYIPEVRFTDIRLEFTNVENKKFIVKSYGAKTGVRGAKEMGQRPTLAVLDDLVSDEDARSDTVIASIEDTVYKAVSYALHPKKQKIIWSGTPFNSRDPLYKAIESGAWNVNVFPACEQFPCSKEDFRSGWPDRFTYEYIESKYDTALKVGKIDSFNQELMLRIMSDEDRLILDSDIQWYNRNTLMLNRDAFNFYITTDFATSEAATADFSVVCAWALNSNGDWFLVNGTMKRQQMDGNIDDLFTFVQEYRPESVGVEISGQQKAFISWIQEEMQRRNIYFNLAKEKGSNQLGIRPVTNKLQRFRAMEPLFKMGKIFLPNEMKDTPFMKEALNELSLASFFGFKSKHDDFLDNVSMLGVLPTWRPSADEGSRKKKDSSGLWDFEIEEPEDNFQSYLV